MCVISICVSSHVTTWTPEAYTPAWLIYVQFFFYLVSMAYTWVHSIYGQLQYVNIWYCVVVVNAYLVCVCVWSNVGGVGWMGILLWFLFVCFEWVLKKKRLIKINLNTAFKFVLHSYFSKDIKKLLLVVSGGSAQSVTIVENWLSVAIFGDWSNFQTAVTMMVLSEVRLTLSKISIIY